MKILSLTTFVAFLVGTYLRLFSSPEVPAQKENIFSNTANQEEAGRTLSELKDVYKEKVKQSEVSKNETIAINDPQNDNIDEESFKEDPKNEQEELSPEVIARLKEELEYKEISFERSFFRREQNLFSLNQLQNEMYNIRDTLKSPQTALTKWPVRLIYFLVLERHYNLTELHDISTYEEIGISDTQWENLRSLSEGKKFHNTLLSYKGYEQNEAKREVASQAFSKLYEKDNEREMQEREDEHESYYPGDQYEQ